MGRGTLLVGQSGGATAVINATLAGVVTEASGSVIFRGFWACGMASRVSWLAMSWTWEACRPMHCR